MDRRFVLFMVLAVTVMAANTLIIGYFFPPEPAPKQAAKADAKQDDAKQGELKAAAGDDAQAVDAEAKPDGDEPTPADAEPGAEEEARPDAAAQPAAEGEKDAEPQIESQRLALGSGDPASPYRMLVYLTNDGAAIERLEMNSPQYLDLEDRSGSLGYLSPADAPNGAAPWCAWSDRVLRPRPPASSQATSSPRSARKKSTAWKASPMRWHKPNQEQRSS